ncbi:MAG: winged helix-turn-helix domain-containing protein [Nocardioidaceae bacterium]
MSTAQQRLSVDAARRIALAAQGFADDRPAGRVDVRHVRRAIGTVGGLQLDSVNVLCRSHYLPVFARVGPYPRKTLDRMGWAPHGRELFEFWGHQASLLPLSMYPLLRWRMQAAQRWTWDTWSTPGRPGIPPRDWSTRWDPAIYAPWAVISGMTRLSVQRPEWVGEVLAMVAERGPVTARDASPDGRQHGDGQDYGTGTMWNWQDTKIALEWLLCTGQVTTATRRAFERVYDLTERVVPADVLTAPAVAPEDAQRELLRIAARAQGIATAKQLRDYFMLTAEQSKPRLAELVDTKELEPARIEGGSQQLYLWAAARQPRRVSARALLSPFDPLVRDRDRTLRLFDFHYRISIYTPAAQRTQGYYVLPFLLGDRLVARVDLKSDRKAAALLVGPVTIEPEASLDVVATELADELRLMADWLELDRIQVSGEGNLGRTLGRALNPRS